MLDVTKNLILIKNSNTGKFGDKTADVDNISYCGDKVSVTYLNGTKSYNYHKANVIWLKNPKLIMTEHVIVYADGFPKEATLVLDFGEYIKIFESNRKVEAYPKAKITYQNSCLAFQQPSTVFNYFKKLSKYINVLDDGRAVLFSQYERTCKISEESVLATYLSGNRIRSRVNSETLIFPFGFNLSQRQAVKTALENSISIIEGPPGTGKTQTILNIIANVVSKGNTVGVVSGNNSAVSNVQEKLEKNNYAFITALLGKRDNKEAFFGSQAAVPDELHEWRLQPKQREESREQLREISIDLTVLLERKNLLAKTKEELSKILLEKTYFDKTYKGPFIQVSKFSFFRKWSKSSIIKFIPYYENIAIQGIEKKFKQRAYLFFIYGVYKFGFLAKNQKNIILSLKKLYYENSIVEKRQTIALLTRQLEQQNYEELMKQYVDLSVQLFRAALGDRYTEKIRGNYTLRNYIYHFEEFISDYPVILSTTHSIKTSIVENYLFDYLIIDEASQVDLVTATLALSCCKNVVIVGDIQQLHQIVPSNIKSESDKAFKTTQMDAAYNYSDYSIIASLMKLYDNNLPRTLLCEHYRCHPEIIRFCNEKFYNNQLVVMTEEGVGDKPLCIYKTAPGNHARRITDDEETGWYNQRQIEVIKDEILDANKEKYSNFKTIGIISPYRKHVSVMKEYIQQSAIEVDTIHKFQGREKETIIFTTVANEINSFIDDPNLINVAVSRAIKELIIVTSNKLFKQHGTNLGDLLRYIEYSTLGETVIESKKISVFDKLYTECSDELVKIRTSPDNVSMYKSENLMYGIITEVLDMPEFSSFKCVIHVPLNSIVKDFSVLNEEDRAYALHPWTHVDFLIFNKLDKEPVLAIEVDGFEYHRNSAKQRYRDAIKNRILSSINLHILRFATNESGEKQRLIRMLKELVEESSC